MSPLRKIQAEDLYQFQLINAVRLSPDGQKVVFSVSRVDPKTEKKYSSLWWVNTAAGSIPQPFTQGDHADSSPRWKPDGKQIAFLSNRADADKPAQLFLISTAGGEAQQFTHFEGAIHAFSWSLDGFHLLITAVKTDAEVVEREKDETRKKLGVVSRHYKRLFYKLDGFGYLPQERQHIWILDAQTGEMQQLTDHEIDDERDAAFSPDAQSIAFISNRTPDPDMQPDYDDLFVMPASGSNPSGEMRKIAAPVGSKSMPSFSPDGKWIAYYAQEGERQGYRNTNVWVVAADGSSPARNLTGAYDLHASPWTINDQGEPELTPPVWSLDGKTLYFTDSYHGSARVLSISVEDCALQILIGEGGVAGAVQFDAPQRTLCYTYGTMLDPGQVFVRNMSTGETRQLTQFNRDLLDGIDLGQMEEVWYKGPDQNDLQGWILKPPGFDPAKKYPSILEIHGGPLVQYGNFFMHEFYYLASAGYVVYFTNPRGGRGYGEAHAGAIASSWGDRDYADLMAWTDLVSHLPYIDPQRMGVTGGSYGGYMTVWIIGHTQRFQAAVSQRCVSNFVSMWGSSDFNWGFQEDIGLGDKAPFEDLQGYWDRSPIKYIGNAHTPTLVIHNEMDHRCPIEQSEQVFVALKRLGVETEFVRFPDEFHGLSRNGRTDRRIARLNHIRRWFDLHIM